VDFCIVNLSTSATNLPQYGGELTADVLDQVAAALEVQANRDCAPYWGGVVRVRAATAAGDGALPTEIPMIIVDDLSIVDPGADAFHTLSGTGVPTISAGRVQCSSLTVGADALSVSLSHELLETMGDGALNAERDDGQGWDWHQEICDETQEDSYAVQLDGAPPVSVSNFVLPAFYNPLDKTGPWDFMALVRAPFSLRPGGYITRRPTAGPSADVQIFGKMDERRLAKKRLPSSRTYRRGGRP
jgi:hypothetical protein